MQFKTFKQFLQRIEWQAGSVACQPCISLEKGKVMQTTLRSGPYNWSLTALL